MVVDLRRRVLAEQRRPLQRPAARRRRVPRDPELKAISILSNVIPDCVATVFKSVSKSPVTFAAASVKAEVEESAKSVEKAISVGTSNAALTAISCSVAEMRVVKMAYPVEKNRN